MTDSNYTAIQVLVDRSGSMVTIRADAEGALAAFLKEQVDVPGRATVRLSEFDTEYETVYPSTLVAAVPKYRLQPRGGTALNDAIGRSINEFGAELAGLHENARPRVVIFVIITDGEENSSIEFATSQVKEMIERQQKEWNWRFVFLAANQDAILTGASYGIQRGSSMTFAANRAGTQNVGAALSTFTTNTRSGVDYEFTDEERAAAQDKEQ